ncbi:chaplin family protein [Phycicoccus sonneratiae]|uniref:DUF320 domain-containing protein n=1 Tax=Phycicoccus sonneratiae TaxID=2807628 RepID=A0ABS2CMT1_9MICO|nr:chaplin family protein [Phycicoccus sonneraticus]MBM6401176.1 DUF320 domain-containing protein [Phycicoccus sonneraticus]
MHVYMRRGLQVALLVGGGVLFASPAWADDTTSGSDGLLGGNQVVAAVTAPVTAAGNAVSVLGDSHSEGSKAASSAGSGSSGGVGSTSGEDSAGGGNQATAPVSVPVTVGGNAVSVVGDSDSEGSKAASSAGSGSSGGVGSTSGEDSAGGGNQATAPVSVPVTVGGNAISVVGDSHSEGAATGTSTGSSGTDGASSTTGEDSVLGGNQVGLPVSVPVTVGGNAVSVVGDSTTEGSSTGSPPGTEDPGTPGTPGDPGTPDTPGDTDVPAGSVTPSAVLDVVAAQAAAPQLAQTGVETGALLALALALLLAGAALITTSRGTPRASRA